MLAVNPVTPYIPRRSTARDPWDADEAQRVLAAAGQSGLSLSAFARRHGLSDRQLYWWRAQFRSHPDLEPVSRSFVRVDTQSVPSRESSGVEIVVADVRVRVAPGFCPTTFAQAVAALRSLPC